MYKTSFTTEAYVIVVILCALIMFVFFLKMIIMIVKFH